MLDNHRLELLRKDHYMARDILKAYHNGSGWQAEAFLSAFPTRPMSVEGNVLAVERIPNALRPWICPAENLDWFTVDNIKEYLSTILAEQKLAAPSSSPAKSPSPPMKQQYSSTDKHINFTTFCKLCNIISIQKENI